MENSKISKIFIFSSERFSFSSFLLSFLNLQLQLLSKLEIKDKFLKFPSFQFALITKTENSEILEIFYSKKMKKWQIQNSKTSKISRNFGYIIFVSKFSILPYCQKRFKLYLCLFSKKKNIKVSPYFNTLSFH